MDRLTLGLVPLKDIERELLSQFTCGECSLDEFLHKKSESFERELYSTTWIAINPDDGVVGFFSLCNSSVRLANDEKMSLNLDLELF